MPIVDVTVAPDVSVSDLERLRALLPDLVARAVDCPEEQWQGPPKPGDIDLRFHARHELDVGYIAVVVEIRTKLFPSRAEDRERRADVVRSGLGDDGFADVGVWLILSEGAWSQS